MPTPPSPTPVAVPGLTHAVTAFAYAKRHGLEAGQVVSQVRRGDLKGARYGRVWYVEAGEAPPGPAGTSERPLSHTERVAQWSARDLRALQRLWPFTITLLFSWRYLEHKTGLRYRKGHGLERFAEPREWGDAFSALAADWPLLLFMVVAVSGGVVFVILRSPKYASAK